MGILQRATSVAALANLLSLDGAGSLLDSDFLDGVSSASFARSGANTDITSLAGTITNDNAAAGKIGEYLSANLDFGSATSLTTATAKTVTSVSLTAGDWDVWAQVGFTPNAATTVTNLIGAINSTTNALPSQVSLDGGIVNLQQTFTTGVSQVLPPVYKRVSLSATTTYFVVAQAAFGVNSMAAWGGILARRRR